MGVRKGRQCVIPEVSRSRRSRPIGSRAQHVAFDELLLPIFWNEDRHRVNLGDVLRMLPLAYERLFLYRWPGGALANSTEVSRVQKLKDIKAGTWRVVIHQRH